MQTLENMHPNKGSNKKRKRLGRGPGSGWGKTCGKGQGGQKSRKGGRIAPGFEGGQMPLYRRLPKRGFYNVFRTEYDIVNLDMLNRFSEDVTPEVLAKAGLIKNTKSKIKLLGRGTLEKGLKISVHKASRSAKDSVEKAGGSLEILNYA